MTTRNDNINFRYNKDKWYKGYSFTWSNIKRNILHGFIYILSVSKKSGGFGKYRAGGTFGSGAFHGKIRECQGSVIPDIIA